MRANKSWPRSSVPSGCAQAVLVICALKSMSWIATRQKNGPKATASIISARIPILATASRCRRNRRQVSSASEGCRALRPAPPTPALAIRDARIEPAIEDISDQVEQDHKTGEHEGHGHDHRRVVGQNGADQQRSDAGNAKYLLGDDGASEHGRH